VGACVLEQRGSCDSPGRACVVCRVSEECVCVPEEREGWGVCVVCVCVPEERGSSMPTMPPYPASRTAVLSGRAAALGAVVKETVSPDRLVTTA
jgi:hypothetical protein